MRISTNNFQDSTHEDMTLVLTMLIPLSCSETGDRHFKVMTFGRYNAPLERVWRALSAVAKIKDSFHDDNVGACKCNSDAY